MLNHKQMKKEKKTHKKINPRDFVKFNLIKDKKQKKCS